MNKKKMAIGISSILLSTIILSSAIEGQASQTGTTSFSQSQMKLTSKNVSNWEEFKAAIEDSTVTDISLTADISLNSTLLAKGNVKNIYGNGHTIDAKLNEIKLYSANAEGLMRNVKIINTDIYGLLWSDAADVKVTYENVEHDGKQLIYLPFGTLILEGKVISHCTEEEVFQGLNLEVLADADVILETKSLVNSPINQYFTNASLKVGKNAKLNVSGNALAITGGYNFNIDSEGEMLVSSDKSTAIHGLSGSSYTFKDGSSLKAVANDPIEEGVEATNGSIYVHKGATFDVESSGVQGTIISGKSLVFEDGSNFSVTNNNSTGVVFGSYGGATNVQLHSSVGLNTWKMGAISDSPKMYENSINAIFDLNGYLNTVIQQNMDSNDDDFAANFETGQTGKITGGSYVGGGGGS